MSLPRTWSREGPYFIPLKLQLLSRMIEREMSRQIHASFEISAAEWRVLALTCTSGPASAADVSAWFETDRGQVSRAVASLLEKGLIERDDGSNARKTKTITPSARGKEVFDVLHIKRQAYYGAIMSGISPENAQHFEEMLTSIAARVDQLRAETEEPVHPGIS